MDSKFKEQINSAKKKLEEIELEISKPENISNYTRFANLGKEQKRLQEIINLYDEILKIEKEEEEANNIAYMGMGYDDELVELALIELEELKRKKEEIEKKLMVKLIPPDPNDSKNVIVEIRAGTGGEEAALFAGVLFKMYYGFAEKNNWKVEVLSSNSTDLGGFKEIIFLLSGPDVYRKMKFEAGVHRVQRIPVTEASGRIHTSAASVAILPEPDDVEVNIKPDELEIDVFRSSGPGGQSVNKTDSAVRIKHIPSGIVVSCQDERSQHKNKEKALKILRARLFEIEQEKKDREIGFKRKQMVGSGDRSEKIRTYNYPQNRVTDHRIHFTSHNLESILQGNLDEIISALEHANIQARLEDLIKINQ